MSVRCKWVGGGVWADHDDGGEVGVLLHAAASEGDRYGDAVASSEQPFKGVLYAISCMGIIGALN